MLTKERTMAYFAPLVFCEIVKELSLLLNAKLLNWEHFQAWLNN